MSDELKIELQVETDDSKARSQLNDLISEFNNKKPIDLKINIGDTNLETFKNSIKSITADLTALSNIDFGNLRKVESNLLSITNLVKNFQDLNKNNKSTGSSVINNPISDIAHEFDNSAILERLSKDHSVAIKEIQGLQKNADFIKDAFEEYNKSMKEAYESFDRDNADITSAIKELEGASDTGVFKKLVEYRRELSDVIREYNSLDVKLKDNSKVYENFRGDTWTTENEKYVAQTEMSIARFEQQVERAKELNARKNTLLRNIQNNLYNNKKTASEDEKVIYELLNKKYEELEIKAKDFIPVMPETYKGYMIDTFNSLFELDFSNLDMNFDDDLRKAYDRFFDVLKEVLKRLDEDYVMDKAPAMEGRFMSMTLSPKTKK